MSYADVEGEVRGIAIIEGVEGDSAFIFPGGFVGIISYGMWLNGKEDRIDIVSTYEGGGGELNLLWNAGRSLEEEEAETVLSFRTFSSVLAGANCTDGRLPS